MLLKCCISQACCKRISNNISLMFKDSIKITVVKKIVANVFFRIDDIEDNSILRRGVPVAPSIYGVPMTINSANYMYFVRLENVLTLQHLQVTFIRTY